MSSVGRRAAGALTPREEEGGALLVDVGGGSVWEAVGLEAVVSPRQRGTGDGQTGGCCGGVSGGRRVECWCECECEEGWTGRGCARGCGRVRLVLGAGDGVDRRGWTCRIGGVE